MAIINDWIKNILVIIVISILFELLLPSSSLKKYIEMVLGLFIVVTLLNPIVNIFERDFTFSQAMWEEYNPILPQENKEGPINSKNKETILQVYKKRISEQTQRLAFSEGEVNVADVQVSVGDDPQKDDFGMIRELTVIIEAGGQEAPDSVAAIAPVVINVKKDEMPSGDKVGVSENYLRLEEKLINKIAEYWGVEPERVKVQVKEK